MSDVNQSSTVVDFSGRNLNESSEELITLLMKNPEITDLDLSDNCLTKLPLEIKFLSCLQTLDIRNNNFKNFEETVNTLSTIKALSVLNLDLMDSNEAMLVLNKLPNIQILNGRSTKEEDDSGDVIEEESLTQSGQKNYTNMEQIEEVKNLETSSNFNSNSNIRQTDSNQYDGEVDSIKEEEGENGSHEEQEKENFDDSDKINKPLLIEKIVSNEKEDEKTYKKNNSKDNISLSDWIQDGKGPIDLNKIELSSLAISSSAIDNNFKNLLDDFSNFLNNKMNYKNMYNQEQLEIEKNKSKNENYIYLIQIANARIKVLKSIFESFFQVIKPTLNKDSSGTLVNGMVKEIFLCCDSLINIFQYFQPKIKKVSSEFTKLFESNEELSHLMNEKNSKIESLERFKESITKAALEEKLAYEAKINLLETENKSMLDKVLSKAKNLIETNVEPNKNTPLGYVNTNTSSKPKNSAKESGVGTPLTTCGNKNFTSRRRSPIRPSFGNSVCNTITGNSSCINNISLTTLKELINEIYKSKTIHDKKCIENKLPRETMEQHMYTFLNKKYGLKNLIIEWAKNIIHGIKKYSKYDSTVLLFGKIMRNEQEEDARFTLLKVQDSISELLQYYIKSKNPLKSADEIEKLLKNKKNSELFEEEWKGIIYYIYEIEEAKEIEARIENYMKKKYEEKKNEIDSYVLTTSKNNNTITLSNTMRHNSNNNSSLSSTTRLSREERVSMLSQIKNDNSILFKDFNKIILDYHIRLRDKQLKNFVSLFKTIDIDNNGIINEYEFGELIRNLKVYPEDQVEDYIFKFLSIIDPFDNQKITFSECVSLFSNETVEEGEEKVSLLEKVCLN